MTIAEQIQTESELFAYQNVRCLDIDYNEWQDVDMEFQYEGLNIELKVKVYVREPMFKGSIDQPREDPTYEFGDVTVTHIEMIH